MKATASFFLDLLFQKTKKPGQGAEGGAALSCFNESLNIRPTLTPGETLPYSKNMPYLQLSGPAVSISIDDGWKSAITAAFPILQKHALPATFFIVTEFLPDSHFPHYLNAGDLAVLNQAGHEIGAHTHTHRHLPQLAAEEYREEILRSKIELEKLGLYPISFAYPYGEYTDHIIGMVEQLGFRGAKSVIHGLNATGTDPYRLCHQGVHADTPFEEIAKWIDEANDQNSWLILTFHQIDRQGRQYSTTPEMFDRVCSYLKRKNIPVKTIGEVLKQN